MPIWKRMAIALCVKRNRRDLSSTGTGWIVRQRFECRPPCASRSGVSATV